MGRGRPRHPDILTPREWEVLGLVREGLTNGEVAERLGITLAGARYHVSEILSKLGVPTREEAAAWEPEREPVRRWSLALWGKVALGAAAMAALVGLGVLAWGVAGSGGSGASDGVTQPSATTPSGPSPSNWPDPAGLRLSYVLDGSLYVVDVMGTVRDQRDDTGACRGGTISWSPLVSRVLCWDWGEISLLGQEGTPLGSWGEEDIYPDAEWSPGNEAFAYQSSEGIVIRNSEGGMIATLGHADFAPAAISVASGSRQWSPGGRRFADWNADNGEMRVFSLDTRSERSFPGDFRPLGWLADGRTVLVAHGYKEPDEFKEFPYEFHLLDVETGATVRLPELEAATDPRIAVNPQLWLSPDTTRLATLVRRSDGFSGLAVFDMGSRQLAVIPDSIIRYGSEFIPPANVYWSRDGQELYWVDQPGDSTVYRAKLDGTGPERLGNFRGLVMLSPDLTAVAYVEFDSPLTGTLVTDSVRSGARVEIASRAGTGGAGLAIPFAWVPPFEAPSVTEEKAIGFVVDQLRLEGSIGAGEAPQLSVDELEFREASERAAAYYVDFPIKPEGYNCPPGANCPFPGVDADARGWLVIVQGLKRGPGGSEANGYIAWVGEDSGMMSSYLPSPNDPGG